MGASSKPKYTVGYFINKFKSIPESKWITGRFVSYHGDRACALGHCGARSSITTAEQSALERIIWKELHLTVPSINDYSEFVPGKHPKERILLALETIRDKEGEDYHVDRFPSIKAIYEME